MKTKIILLLILIFSFTSCSLLLGYKYYVLENQFGRAQLKDMRLKKTFDKSKTDIIDFDALYYYHNESLSIDKEYHFIYRFFDTGQYAFFANSQNPIIGLSYDNYDYNNLDKATYVGYYNIKKDIIILEYPNHVFGHGGVRQLEKYRVLDNGDLDKIVNFWISDHKALYKKIQIPEEKKVKVVPDW